jgi:BirA family transcriptional regulator, biotin operon repressor / biotin---[acetyl-CoA-carboxylase] ligase
LSIFFTTTACPAQWMKPASSPKTVHPNGAWCLPKPKLRGVDGAVGFGSLRPTRGCILQNLGLLPLLVGASLAKTIVATTGIEVHLKWSNDLLSPDGRKFCGILCEHTSAALLLGIGINLLPQAFPPELRAAALEEYAPVQRWHLLEAIVTDLQTEYRHFLEQPQHALQLWKAQPNTLGRTVQVLEPDGTRWDGVALDLDASGGLLVQTPSQTKIVHAADVSLRHSPNL